jgi:hypothetical protein
MEYAAQHRIGSQLRYGLPDDDLVAMICTASAVVTVPHLGSLGLVSLSANNSGMPAVRFIEGGL